MNKINGEVPMLTKFKKSDLVEYLKILEQHIDIDLQTAYDLTLKTIKYYQGDAKYRFALRRGQDIENNWYESLERGEPDYSLYDDDYFAVEIWACWVVYSRKYLNQINKAMDLKGINSIIDMGCGIGYTTATLKQMCPNAKVLGTNIEGTTQYKVASHIGEKYGFNLIPKVNQQADMIFASEYFEHIEEPIQHIEDVVKICSPKFLVIANAFGAKSMGHFNFYKVGDKRIENKKIGRVFNAKLRDLGYKQLKLGFWNNRPQVWKKYE